MTNLFSDLSWRGLIHQTTDDDRLSDWLNSKCRSVYAGFDPTAESLHVGSLMPLLMLRRFQQAGHRVIALVGGATGMIGDPTGKSQERQLLSEGVLRENVAGIQAQMQRFLDFDCGETSAVIVNNYDWIGKFSYLEFLRDVGRNFPVNVMLAKDSVKGRLDRSDVGLSFTEFSYMLLQAYDFVHLYDKYECELQLGGSDQWGNITAGIDLARRMRRVQLYGLTHPLLTKSDGTKMGKTESGAVWLSPERTSPYAFYQYWFNVDDADVGRCLRQLTELEHDEIEVLDKACSQRPEKRESQTRLAEEMTRIVHSDTGVATAKRAQAVLFGGEAIDGYDDRQLAEIFNDVPSEQLSRSRLEGEGVSLIDALVEAKLAKSKSEARRTITQGGAYVNNYRRDAIDTHLKTTDLASETIMVLRSGRRRYALLRFSG